MPNVSSRAASAAALILAFAALAAGCGSVGESETSRTLRIYVSQPLKGDRGGEDMLRAIEIAAEDEGNRVDSAAIEIVGLNDSDESGNWVAGAGPQERQRGRERRISDRLHR